MLTLDMMQRRWPHGEQHIPGLLAGIVDAAADVFSSVNMNTPLVIAHAMAQFSEECGQGLEMVESLNYTAARICVVWPSHFTPSMAARCAHNARTTGDIAYGGRMGNAPPPSDDGFNYRGRGLSQVTGRDGYEALKKVLVDRKIDLDIMSTPDLVCEPQHTLLCGVLDFVLCGCLPHAEKDDVISVTRALNGGLLGLAERRRQLALWKRELRVN